MAFHFVCICYLLLLFLHYCHHIFDDKFGFFSCFSFLLNCLNHFDLLLDFPVFCVCHNKVKPSIQDTDLCLLLSFVILPWFQSIWRLYCCLFGYYSELLLLFHYIYHVSFSYFSSFLICGKYVSLLCACLYQMFTWITCTTLFSIICTNFTVFFCLYL